jgi:hypothetical protein
MKLLETEHQFRGFYTDGGICRIEVYTADARPPLVVATELPENPVASITYMAEYLAAEVMERYLTPTHLRGYRPPLLWIEHYERTAADRRIGLTESWEQITFAHYRRERTRKFARVPGFRYRIGLPLERDLLIPERFADLLRPYDP